MELLMETLCSFMNPVNKSISFKKFKDANLKLFACACVCKRSCVRVFVCRRCANQAGAE